MHDRKRKSRVLLGDFTRIEIRELIESGRTRVGVVPVAATEQHLHHLEMATDCLVVETITRKAAEKLEPLAVISPTVSVGVSEHHMKHSGSLTSRWEVFTEYIFDIVESLARGGIPKMLIVNGHGGNVRPITAVLEEFRRRIPKTELDFLSYWDIYPDDVPLKHMESGTAPGHAGEFETSVLRYLDSQRVHEEYLTDPEARLGSRAKGRALMDAAVDALAEYIEAFAAGKIRPIEAKSWVAGDVRRGIRWHPFVSRGRKLPGEDPSFISHPTDDYD